MATTDTAEILPEAEKQTFFGNLHLPVFLSANAIIFLIIAVALLHPDASDLFAHILAWITENLSWYYLLSVGIILITFIFAALSKYGTLKLGPDHAEAEYSDGSWFAMLFSTGMGIGIMFFGVAEPLLHYLSPPVGDAETINAAREAMNITFFHWGLHAWAIYGIVGLILAYFSFRMKLPLALRSALYPIIGDKIYGRWGDAIDTFAVVGTVFGVATTLGFGVVQINTGLSYIFPNYIDVSPQVQVVLIIATTLCATLSVSLGLDRGIKILSETNLVLAFVLVLFIFLFGGKIVYLLEALMQNIGLYFPDLFQKTFNLYTYESAASAEVKATAQGWLGGWTIAYWGWWIAWSPFVGMFIARISRGRTIRNFVGGVLLIPAGFTFFWMTTFGNSAIDMISSDGITELKDVLLGPDGSSKALFAFISHFPVSDAIDAMIPADLIRGIISFVAVVMVAVFFITSADSGALVMNMLASKDEGRNSPLWQRVFWGSITGIIAIVLLINGGLEALQTVSTMTAFPFSLIILASIWGLYKAFRTEYGKIELRDKAQMYIQPIADSGGWEKRLHNLMEYPDKAEVARFIRRHVVPVFADVKKALAADGVMARISADNPFDVRLEVDHGEHSNFTYRVKACSYLKPEYIDVDEDGDFEDDEDRKYYRAEVYLDDGSKGYDIMGYTDENISNDIVDQYTSHTYYIQNFEAPVEEETTL